jgi:hypothetical protein
MKLSRSPILILLILLFLIPVSGDGSFVSKLQVDTQDTFSNYNPRSFDTEKLEQFKRQSVYDYSIQRSEGRSFWGRILAWIMGVLDQILSSEGGSIILRVIFYGAMIGAIVFSILKLINANPTTIFGNPKSQTIPYNVEEENIHKIDYQSEIGKAIENHDYRLATRLYYLQALKLLSDKELIHWEIGKTNSDYFYEIKPATLRNSFSSLGHMFEYAWYGGFEVGKPILKKARALYEEIRAGYEMNGK